MFFLKKKKKVKFLKKSLRVFSKKYFKFFFLKNNIFCRPVLFTFRSILDKKKHMIFLRKIKSELLFKLKYIKVVLFKNNMSKNYFFTNITKKYKKINLNNKIIKNNKIFSTIFIRKWGSGTRLLKNKIKVLALKKYKRLSNGNFFFFMTSENLNYLEIKKIHIF